MTRVAQVLAGAPRGGAENFFVRLLLGLQSSTTADQRAFIRCHPERVRALQAGGVDIDCFRFGGPLDLLDRRRFVKTLRRYQPDIVMAWMNRGMRATPRGRYKLVSRLGNYYDLKYHRHADYWIGISRGICDYLVREGMPANRVLQIPNFADEEPAAPVPRTSFGTQAGRPLVLAAGRLHSDKGFDTLIRAIAEMPDVSLWLAGSGPEERPLRRLVDTLDMGERVRFLGWRSDVTALMRTADLFVCPSRHEGLGSIVLEAWAHQCPIVATAAQGPAELIDDGTTGLLTPIDKVASLAAAMTQLLQAPAERERLARAGLARYQRDFSEAAVVAQYRQAFSAIAQGRS